MTELALIQSLTPMVFTEKGKLDEVIEDIRSRVANFNGDVTTTKGRDEIKSFAFRIAKSKTALDGLGKECVEEWKTKSKIVDAERKRVWDIFEDLQKQVRKPVTDWELAVDTRINNLKQRINDLWPDLLPSSSADLALILEKINAVIIDESFAEFTDLANDKKSAAVACLAGKIEEAKKREADALELDNLRKEAAIRAQQDRDEAIRKEAAEKATREAEAKARAETEAVERQQAQIRSEAALKEHALKIAAEKAQRELLEAKQKAERAVEEERQRVAAAAAKVAAEEAKREANKKHRAATHKAIIQAFQDAGLPNAPAEIALNAIALDLIPNVKITY